MNREKPMYLKFCDTELKWFDYTPPQTDLYEEARDEAVSLWRDGWITKYECRRILVSLYHKKYLTISRPILINPHRFYDGV
jgi:hypothetical protein